MNRWIRTSVVIAGLASAAAIGRVVGGAPQQPGPVRQLPPGEVVIVNDAKRPIPVHAEMRGYVMLDPGTQVRITPSQWEYRELRIPIEKGIVPDIASQLNAESNQGWEATGLAIQTPSVAVIVLKRVVTRPKT